MFAGILPRRAVGALVGCALALLGGLVITPPAPVSAQANQYIVGLSGDNGGHGNGLGDLRWAITQANNNGGNPSIRFVDVSSIHLNSPLPALAKDVTIYTYSGVTVDGGCTFSNGACMSGTGVQMFTVNSGVTATIIGLTIQHGNGGAAGGGIINNGTLDLSYATLTANSGGSGGGITNNGSGTLDVTNSTLAANSATYGGGIYNTGTATVTNSTLSGNIATGGTGGGIFNNTGKTLTLTNTIVAASTGTNIGGSVTVPSHNLLTSNDGGITNGDAHGDIVTATPLLGTLSSNGGTIPLLAGSPAIGAGDHAVCASTTVPAAAPVGGKDERGLARPAATCAIGAFEPQTATYTVGSTSDTGAMAALTTCADGGSTTCQLRDALAYASSGQDTIAFTATGPITVGSTLTLVTNVTIAGPTSGPAVIVDGGCTFTNGACTGVTGVTVFTVNSGVTAAISNLTIQHGNARTGNGFGGGILNAGTLSVTNCTLSGNAAAAIGGGIFSDGTLTVTTSTLTGNSAVFGGGLYSNGGIVTVTGSTLSGNSATDSGGGIVNKSGLTLTNSTLTGNTATNDGGGVYNIGTVTVTNSTLSGNHATNGQGGGIINSGGTATVTNSTLAGNSASQGGGIYKGNGGAVMVTNSTLSGNSANNGYGGGINIFGGTVTLTNTIVANAPTGGDIVNSGSVTGTNNLIDDAATTTGFSDGTNHNIIGHPAGLAAALGSNGGPTQTIALLAGSLAIGAGSPTVCALPLPPATPPNGAGGKDQRGLARQAAVCSIGAFEAQVAIPNALPGPQPPGPAGGPSNPLPVSRPSGSPGGSPNPLPAPRP